MKSQGRDEEVIPTSKDELDDKQKDFTRQAMHQWLVNNPDEAEDAEAVKKIERKAKKKIGHHPADSMLVGMQARVIEMPPPDSDNNTSKDPRHRLLQLQHESIGSLQGTLVMLLRRHRLWHERHETQHVEDKAGRIDYGGEIKKGATPAWSKSCFAGRGEEGGNTKRNRRRASSSATASAAIAWQTAAGTSCDATRGAT